jgi:transcriptional regulator with XRE-family HTH domain
MTFAKMDIRKKIGKRVKELRQEKNLSQEALAHLSELDRTYIPSIEKGERNVSIEVIQKLAKAFDLKISEFLKGLD